MISVVVPVCRNVVLVEYCFIHLMQECSSRERNWS